MVEKEYYESSQQQQQHQPKQPPQHLDLIDFCLAEFDITEDEIGGNDEAAATADGRKKQWSSSVTITSSSKQQQLSRQRDQLKSINMRKWPPNRIVNYDQLGRFKRTALRFYNDYMEKLLLFQIGSINKYVSFLELEKIVTTSGSSSNLAVKKRLIVDTKVLRSLERKGELNWLPMVNSLYPIMTIGDGNCLCHAVLNYMIGMQDMNLSLRETLKTYINSREVSDQFKERWMLNRQEADRAIGVQVDMSELEKEWDEIKKMELSESTRANNNNNGQSQASPGDARPQATTASTKKNKGSPAATAATTAQATTSLLYLEDIHIFALANMLQRPIIVIALERLQNIQPIHLRGIYLPVMAANEPSSAAAACVKDPIVIAFHRYHFVPLVFALDNESTTRAHDLHRTLTYTSRYSEFENVDRDAAYYDVSPSSARYQYEYDSMNVFQPPKKLGQIYNVLPLVYKNNLNEHMKVHFLKPTEKENQISLLRKYLKIVDIEVNASVLEQTPTLSGSGNDQKVSVMCCYLDYSTEKPTPNGISLYIDYLNEMLNSSSSSSSSAYYQHRTAGAAEAPSPNYNQSSTSSSGYKCVNDYCNQEAMNDRSKYYGLCYQCFRRQIQLDQEHVVDEVEAEKIEQQLEHFFISPSDLPPIIEKITSFERPPSKSTLTTSEATKKTVLPSSSSSSSSAAAAATGSRKELTRWDIDDESYDNFSSSSSAAAAADYSRHNQLVPESSRGRHEIVNRVCVTPFCYQMIQSSPLHPNDSTICDSCIRRGLTDVNNTHKSSSLSSSTSPPQRSNNSAKSVDFGSLSESAKSRNLPRTTCVDCGTLILGNASICHNCQYGRRTPPMMSPSMMHLPSNYSSLGHHYTRPSGEIEIPVQYSSRAPVSHREVSSADLLSNSMLYNSKQGLSHHSLPVSHGGGTSTMSAYNNYGNPSDTPTYLLSSHRSYPNSSYTGYLNR